MFNLSIVIKTNNLNKCVSSALLFISIHYSNFLTIVFYLCLTQHVSMSSILLHHFLLLDINIIYFLVLMVRGRNGKHLLMHNGYTYYQHKILRDGFRWSCTQMGSRSCRGFLHVTNDNLVVRAHTEHTHLPSHYLLQRTKPVGELKVCVFSHLRA